LADAGWVRDLPVGLFLTGIKDGRAFCVNDASSAPVGRSEQAEEG
jgi:hypothetical protein